MHTQKTIFFSASMKTVFILYFLQNKRIYFSNADFSLKREVE